VLKTMPMLSLINMSKHANLPPLGNFAPAWPLCGMFQNNHSHFPFAKLCTELAACLNW
jgi:hypothetical protein